MAVPKEGFVYGFLIRAHDLKGLEESCYCIGVTLWECALYFGWLDHLQSNALRRLVVCCTLLDGPLVSRLVQAFACPEALNFAMYASIMHAGNKLSCWGIPGLGPRVFR